MARKKIELYPDFTAEIEYLDNNIKADGIDPQFLQKLIYKHKPNSLYNRKLSERYTAIESGVPIFSRYPRFEEDKPINNKINNDFFSEIIDFKTGYFAGQPISYAYSKTDESLDVTGGEKAVDEATKTLTDFLTRNNMYGADMEMTKEAAICGYCGRLFYIDPYGNERVMITPSYETIVLSNTDISEPEYAIRYYYSEDINRVKHWKVELYDTMYVHTYTGYLSQLQYRDSRPHMFDFCPLQGIANNKEMIGDSEKVISLIDDYDKVLSDNSNEAEAFAHAYMIFENINISDDEIKKGQNNGSFKFFSGSSANGKIYFLTKQVDSTFTENHLTRLEDNIYRLSKTPNLNDETFGSASGIALKFKLHGLETKCGMFEAKVMDSALYMWKVLASAWSKKRISFDPLQVTMDFTRNFPLDTLTEAQTTQALIGAGLPKEIAYSQLSFIDDVDYVMELIEKEKEDIPSLTTETAEDKQTDNKPIQEKQSQEQK